LRFTLSRIESGRPFQAVLVSNTDHYCLYKSALIFEALAAPFAGVALFTFSPNRGSVLSTATLKGLVRALLRIFNFELLDHSGVRKRAIVLRFMSFAWGMTGLHRRQLHRYYKA
jgi:hypothetical protein